MFKLIKIENKTISEKQANEIDTGKEGNSEPGTTEPATIEKKQKKLRWPRNWRKMIWWKMIKKKSFH